MIGRARAALDRAAPLPAGRTRRGGACQADAELAEAGAAVSAGHELESDPARLQAVDDRLHALRQQARKHDCEPDALAEVHSRLAASACRDRGFGRCAGRACRHERQWRDYYQQVAAVVAANRAGRHGAGCRRDSGTAATELDGASVPRSPTCRPNNMDGVARSRLDSRPAPTAE